MGRGPVTVLYPLSDLSQVLYPRAMIALAAATLAVLIDFMLRFRDYRDLRDSYSLVGFIKYLGTFTLVFLQVVAIFYLIILLPGPLRVVVLLLAAFIVIIQLS